jgi:deoxyuridine 5'-triphosphate nucleotidohydrolase
MHSRFTWSAVLNSDYRGEVMVLLINLSATPFEIERGERIVQLIVQAVVRARLQESIAMIKTARGGAGFGSTGSKKCRLLSLNRKWPKMSSSGEF